MIQNRIRNGAQKNIKKTLKYLEIKQHNVWINQNSQFYILNSMGQKKKKKEYIQHLAQFTQEILVGLK